MPRKRVQKYSTISLPMYMIDKLRKFGEFGDTWITVFDKMIKDVDEARDYLLGCLLAVGRIAQLGYCEGVEAASEISPRSNLTGDPYYSDGMRAVIILSNEKTEAVLLGWS